MLAAAYDGHESSLQPPFEYILYRWRKEMSVSWQDAEATPVDVVVRDMEFINLERKIEKEKLDRANA